MLKLNMSLLVVATLLASCGQRPQTPVKAAPPVGWQYQQTEDSLRQTTVSTAMLASNETVELPDEISPLMTLKVIRGSSVGDYLEFVSMDISCGARNLIRVDTHPIEAFNCPRPVGFYSGMSLETELGQRIVASKEVVIETTDAAGNARQITFKTEGLQLPQ